MLDGESVNTSNGSGINTNLNLPLLGYVDRIEVLKGPCSIIHGSGSINGFVNVVQKNGTDNPGGFVNIETAFPGETKVLETGYGYASEKTGDLYLYAGAVQSDGIAQGDARINAFPDISSRFSMNWRKNNFRVSGVYQSETTGFNLDMSPPDAQGRQQ